MHTKFKLENLKERLVERPKLRLDDRVKMDFKK
jgi:hypothetical protein